MDSLEKSYYLKKAHVYVSLLLGLLVLLYQLIGPVPFTLQNFAIDVTVFRPREAMLSGLLSSSGCIGLPCLQEGGAGFSGLLQAVLGFISLLWFILSTNSRVVLLRFSFEPLG